MRRLGYIVGTCCALASQAAVGQLIIQDVVPPFGGQGDIIPGGNIDWGNVDLCVSPPPNDPCEADCNMDGQLNILDFVCYQGLFVAGCP